MLRLIKKHKMLTLILALVVVLAIGAGSSAWFTSDAEITSNYVTTGSLDVATSGGPLTIDNLEPGAGYTSAGWFCVENTGDYDMKWRAKLDPVTDNKGLGQYLQVTAIIAPPAHPGNYGPSNTPIFENAPFNDLKDWNSYLVLAPPADEFEPGHKACYDIRVRLLGTAPNDVQDATASARLYIHATQYINSGWSQ